MKPFDLYHETDYFILNKTLSRLKISLMSLNKLRVDILNYLSTKKLLVTREEVENGAIIEAK